MFPVEYTSTASFKSLRKGCQPWKPPPPSAPAATGRGVGGSARDCIDQGTPAGRARGRGSPAIGGGAGRASSDRRRGGLQPGGHARRPPPAFPLRPKIGWGGGGFRRLREVPLTLPAPPELCSDPECPPRAPGAPRPARRLTPADPGGSVLQKPPPGPNLQLLLLRNRAPQGAPGTQKRPSVRAERRRGGRVQEAGPLPSRHQRLPSRLDPRGLDLPRACGWYPGGYPGRAGEGTEASRSASELPARNTQIRGSRTSKHFFFSHLL